ncbi:MAG: hypothetical protein ACFFC7_07425 [Candidatus Hermodarchaeota archaeon]
MELNEEMSNMLKNHFGYSNEEMQELINNSIQLMFPLKDPIN